MSLLTPPILALAALIIAALASYALYLWQKIWQQQRTHSQTQKAQNMRLGNDLKILASSLLDGQLPLIEGAIRIKVLLDNYNIQLSQNKQCEVFQLIYDATAHIPTHEGWKALSKQQRFDYENLFAQLQSKHQQPAHSAARWLLEHGLKPNANV